MSSFRGEIIVFFYSIWYELRSIRFSRKYKVQWRDPPVFALSVFPGSFNEQVG